MKKCSFKRLGALAMSLIMCFALAVSASAVSAGNYTTTANLKADVSAYVPHQLDFIKSATVATASGVSTVTIVFKNPATVTVTPYGSSTSYTASGTITAASLSAVEENDDYSATYASNVLTITCDEDITAADFAPKFDFTISIDNEEGGSTQHSAVSAWLYLVKQ